MNEVRRGSCDLSGTARNVEVVPRKPEVTVSQEKFIEMKKYAAELRRKFPHMKPDRLKRKVMEYFHIKL